MTHLDDSEIKVIRVLERHRRLDLLQIASLAELSISSARHALEHLAAEHLVTVVDELYSLNTAVLSEMLETA